MNPEQHLKKSRPHFPQLLASVGELYGKLCADQQHKHSTKTF